MILQTLITGLLVALSFSSGINTEQSHRHSKLGDVREEILPSVKIVEVATDSQLKREDQMASRDGRFSAFTSYQERDSLGHRIYFSERATGKTYELTGLPLPHRPFSKLVWLNNRTLVFDRWSQPHYGIHYAVDVKQKKVVIASAFPD